MIDDDMKRGSRTTSPRRSTRRSQFAEAGTWEPVEDVTRFVYSERIRLSGHLSAGKPSPKSLELTYREAMRQAIRDALIRDPRVFLMGEDVARYGGCYRGQQRLLEEFGPERIRDTPLSESGLRRRRNRRRDGRDAADRRNHDRQLQPAGARSDRQQRRDHPSHVRRPVQYPLVIRMTTGAGRQLAAQHSHSLEGWYAHIPGIKVLTPATLEDARGMLWTALEDPDPVLIFEHGSLYNMEGEIAADAGAVDIDRPRCGGPAGRQPDHLRRDAGQGDARRRGACRRLGSTRRSSTCARCARSTPDHHRFGDANPSRGDYRRRMAQRQHLGRNQRAHHGRAFYELDAPVARVCSAEVPMPYPEHLEEAALPQAAVIVAKPCWAAWWGAMTEFRMPSLGADMEAGTLVQWLVKPGDPIKRGDIIAVVETEKGAIEIEIFEAGQVERIIVDVGGKVPVGTPLAHIRSEHEIKAGVAEAPRAPEALAPVAARSRQACERRPSRSSPCPSRR